MPELTEGIEGTQEVRASGSALKVWFDDIDGMQSILKFEGGHTG